MDQELVEQRWGDWMLLGGLTLITFVLHAAFYKGYGFFRDELYFIACSRHLAWGYVDQPPGVAVVAWASRRLLGDTLFAIRFVPMLFAAAQVLFAGLTARAMGGGRYALLLACISVLAAPQYFGSYLNTDMFMMLGWAACGYIAVRILAGGNPRLWLWFGLAAGLALQGKHAMLLFGFAFVVGLLLSPQRKMLLSPWLSAGGAVALIVFLPNLIWEYRHNWATLELLRNIAHSNKDLPVGPWAYFVSNVHSLSTLSFPIWFGGTLWCLLAKAGLRFRALGWMWIVAYVTFIVLKGKTYYLTPIYAPLFAVGAVAVESLLDRLTTKRAWLKPVLSIAVAVTILLYGMIGWPFAMPMMSVQKFIAYEQALGVAPEKWETVSLNQLPQQYADMFGWAEMAAAVARVYDTVAPEERANCGILARNYGEAGAIDYFGRQYGLPHAISGHQSYWLWGPRPYTGECLIVIGNNRETLEKMFASVVQAGETYQQYAIPYENHRSIWIVRGPKFGTLEQVWPKFKAWI
jgi:Dolichyl-phosphate-mannose-protein mannosyltransferase